ncbi:hypothetical protein ES703_00332 [subsurface metagenome]
MRIDEEGQARRIDYGDRIYFDSVVGIAGTTYPIGTAGMPSNTIADVITILAARNLKKIDVHGTLTLGAAMNHIDFIGHYHESGDDIINLGGQDIDNSHFEGLIITGIQGGAGLATYTKCLFFSTLPIPMTGFRGLAENCAIFSGLTVATGNADYADFDHCTSVHGVATVVIGSPDRVSFKEFSGGLILTTQVAGAVFVRGISGYLEVDEMTGGTLDIYAHGADIQINADCTGGTINIYGNARVVIVGAPTVTINDYGSSGYKELPATGATTGAAYIDALNIDARLYNEFTIKIKNTDGANSLDYRVLLRPEHGVAEEMIQPEDITLAPADYDFVNIDHKWGQVIVQVRDTAAPNRADFDVYAICNKQ